ncbi:MAG: glycosyltransferase family 2 protein [Acetobacteraceae bacterium]|nr:glycosyltransferase family 2 protein [Acetobacteraceae bacterium]
MLTSFASPDRQAPYRAAVVIPTVLRPSLLRAVRSVYRQRLDGRVQLLIGVDRPLGSRELLRAIAEERPDFVDVDVLDPGYSTARANGGLYSCAFGGSLRSALTLLANARHVAYLDDDNWIGPDHLAGCWRPSRAPRGRGAGAGWSIRAPSGRSVSTSGSRSAPTRACSTCASVASSTPTA